MEGLGGGAVAVGAGAGFGIGLGWAVPALAMIVRRVAMVDGSRVPDGALGAEEESMRCWRARRASRSRRSLAVM